MLAFFNMIAARMRAFLLSRDIESDFDQEIAAHLEMAEEDGRRRGLTSGEARRAARVQLGGVTQLRESCRAAWGLPWLDGFTLDIKLGLRMLHRSWGLTLAGGLAMTIVITIAAVATAVVDQTFVRQVFGDGNAIGRRVRPVPAPGSDAGPWYEIVGVVPDRPANTSQGRMYFPAQPSARGAASPIHIALHAGTNRAAMARRLQEIGTNLDPTLRLETVRRLDEVYGETQMSSNLTSYALAIVTLSVLVLSAAGLYALMSFTVARRRREIGIRTALGARPGRLLSSIFARALWQIAAGVEVGVTAALLLHRRLNIEVEGGWHIPGILPAAAIFIMTIGLLSAAGPARRAVRVDPTEALRDG